MSAVNIFRRMKTIILMGSKSDQEHAQKIVEILKRWKIPFEQHTASAHKTPEKVLRLIKKTNQMKDICFITIAGRSNALSGLVAANSVHPVIACPPFKDKHDYLINIHSTLQMPSDTPVLTVIDPVNAALAAGRVLASGNVGLRKRVGESIKERKR